MKTWLITELGTTAEESKNRVDSNRQLRTGRMELIKLYCKKGATM